MIAITIIIITIIIVITKASRRHGLRYKAKLIWGVWGGGVRFGPLWGVGSLNWAQGGSKKGWASLRCSEA